MSPRGGKRQGAGRSRGSGRYGEPTVPIRVPQSMVGEIRAYAQTRSATSQQKQAENLYALPLYGTKVAAGFPSPADDFLEGKLDLNEHLVKHPAATFFVRVTGDSMINAGIFPGDILVVDRSLEPVHDRVVIAALDGELTVKKLYKRGDSVRLMPENPDYQPIEIGDEAELHIWGVVTNVIHAL